MAQYRKKPIVVEAIQFLGNDKECMAFCAHAFDPIDNKPSLGIITKDGVKLCYYSDWIVKEGRFFEVYRDLDFHATYEPIQQTTDPLITEGC